MKSDRPVLSSGVPGLDRVLQGLMAGDNVVWQVGDVEEYLPFIDPYVREAQRQQRKLIYFRFARHNPLLKDTDAEVHVLDPQGGFERFVTEILDVIERAGKGAFYVFDCLSDLAADWFSDRMLGNFFRITCPYLFELDTIAYFALLKNEHSFHATEPIGTTAQVIIEVHRRGREIYIHPLKVWQRYTPSMYTLHKWQDPDFLPVTSSATITDILARVPKPWLDFSIHRPGIWISTFQQAQELLELSRDGREIPATRDLFRRLLKMVVTRDERFLKLAEEYFSLSNLVEIMQRMVGTGLIGGKTLGMLLARAILLKASPAWAERLESHDSFFVGSDVFYTYLVQNGCWWLRRRQKDFDTYLERAAQARERILQGSFPDYIENQFREMLEYFGGSPLIVRSSSLLEDNYGNAFAGKYDSVFLANQGTPQERLEAFLNAVRTVYSSAMSEEGLRYRLHHGLLDRDEQMALLVQRVSGELLGELFLPHAAGVGFSFNPFVWSPDIDPQAGMLRLVFGLGTRAVDRTEDDYTRLVALNAPLRRPDSSREDSREHVQRRVDLLDLRANQLVSREFESVLHVVPEHILRLVSTPDEAEGSRFLTFETVLSDTQFVPVMRELCCALQQAYQHPVDIEFTVNFSSSGDFRVNLVQCRPFHARIVGEASRIRVPENLMPDRLLLQSHGPVVGHSLATEINRLIYVVPSVYGQMSQTQRYSVARTVGRLASLDKPPGQGVLMLVGPGRWCTSMPWLGVPASFAEISRASVICELAVMHEGLVPEVSLGTHFFNDLVEMDILYLAVLPGREGHLFNDQMIRARPNQMGRLLPMSRQWETAIWVLDSTSDNPIFLNVDSMKQTAVCFCQKSLQ